MLPHILAGHDAVYVAPHYAGDSSFLVLLGETPVRFTARAAKS